MPSIHRIFVLTIVAKGALGLLQLVTAVALSFGFLAQMPAFVRWLFRTELSEDPSDFLATHLLSLANIAPIENVTFYTVYFAVHGILHLSVVVALLSGFRLANQMAVAVLCMFVIYQLYEWFSIGGVMLLVLTAIDLLVIALTLFDHRQKRP